MKNSYKKITLLVVKFLISTIAIIYAFWNLDFKHFLTIDINWSYVVLAILTSFISVILLGIRWRTLINGDRPPFVTTIFGQFVGMFGNNIFPFRAGELLKTHYVKYRTKNKLIAILGSVVIERSLDVLMILLIVLVLITGHPATQAFLDDNILHFIVVLALFALLVYGSLKFYLLYKLPAKLRNAFNEFTSSFNNLWSFVMAVCFTLLLFTSYAVRFNFVLSSIHIQTNFLLIGLLLVATAAGFLIPAAPGAIGTYHAAVVFMLVTIYGLDTSDAQISAFYLHITSYLPTTVVGFLVYILSGTKFDLQDSFSGYQHRING